MTAARSMSGLAVKCLRRHGYTVFSACNADEAIRFCSEHGGALELVITDVVMPGLGGRELARQLVRMRSGTIALVRGTPKAAPPPA